MNFFLTNRNKKIDPAQWGTERATPDLLGEPDKEWVSLRYDLASQNIDDSNIVLDATCGSGFGSQILSLKAKMVYGIDISKEAINYATKRYGTTNICFSNMNVTKIKYPDNMFDASVGLETIEHIRKYDKYLTELQRVTKPNGKIIISTPRKFSDKPLTPFHVKEFTYGQFKAILKKFFIFEKIVGLKRTTVLEHAVVNDDSYHNYDIYLAVCRNRKYVKLNYSDSYFVDVHNGIKFNTVAQIHIKALAQAIEGTTALSIGCGTGTYEAGVLKIKPELELYGSDIWESPAVRKLRVDNGFKKVFIVKPNRKFKQPSPDDSFDTVYTSHVLEHVEFPEQLIEESVRLSRQIAFHLFPINLNNPDHIHFFKYGTIDNEYRTQEADIDVGEMAQNVIQHLERKYPHIGFEISVVCPRDVDIHMYDGIDFNVKRQDRPDGLMPCFLLKFFKYGKRL